MSKIVTWPQSQTLCEKEGFLENCTLLNSESALDKYGSEAYRVDDEWYEKFINGELADVEYSDEEMENLEVDYEEV